MNESLPVIPGFVHVYFSYNFKELRTKLNYAFSIDELYTYRNLNFSSVDGIAKILGVLSVDSAADGESSTQDFLDGTLKLSGKRLVSHSTSDFDDIVKRNVAAVLN